MTASDVEAVRTNEQRTTVSNPDGAVAPLEALRTVLVFTVTDAFALRPEEVTWLGFNMDGWLSPLIGTQPVSVPAAVRQEMLAGDYTDLLNRIERNGLAAPTRDQQAVSASGDDWTSVLMRMVAECYPLSPVVEAQMRARAQEMLGNLGIGDPHNPRPARYLPTSIRYIVR